jgi:hypothetical protein
LRRQKYLAGFKDGDEAQVEELLQLNFISEQSRSQFI